MWTVTAGPTPSALGVGNRGPEDGELRRQLNMGISSVCNFSSRLSVSQLRDLILEYLMNTDLLVREEEQYFLIRVLTFFFF